MFLHDAGNAATIVANNWNTRPIEDQLRAQLAEAQAKAERYEGVIMEFAEAQKEDNGYILMCTEKYHEAFSNIIDLARNLPPKEG